MRAIKEILSEFETGFKAANFESAELEAVFLVADSLGIPAAELPLQGRRKLKDAEETALRTAFSRRLSGEPLQYIFGTAYFRFLKLKVGPGCLIPRPETELLVETLLKKVPRNGKVCELGAGSGAIGLALASERPDLSVYASELSPDAFKWAALNSKDLALTNYNLLPGDLFSPFQGLRFDALAANLPYIRTEEMATLPKDVRLMEPSSALDGGPDGLDIIRRAVKLAPGYLKPKALLCLEIGEEQGAQMLTLLSSSPFKEARIEKDLCGKDRFAVAEMPA